MRIVGFLDDNPALRGRRIAGQRVLGPLAEAERVIAQSAATEVVVTIADAPHERLAQLGAACADRRGNVHAHASPDGSRAGGCSRSRRSDAEPERQRGAGPTPELVVLFLVYAATAALALWQASNHLSPTIFTDELEMTQLARSFARHGHATLRGQPIHGLAPLAAYLSAPFWWIDDVPTAYALIKAFGALIMAAAVFPAYGLARLAVTPRWALFAAAGTGLSPALAYAPILVKEPTAYPAATLALFLIARWIALPTLKGAVLAAAACVLGLPHEGSARRAVPHPRARRRSHRVAGRARDRVQTDVGAGDWLGAVTLAVGGVRAGGAYIAHRSDSWYVSTTFFQDRMLDFGLWAGGALAIGLGVVPARGGARLARSAEG